MENKIFYKNIEKKIEEYYNTKEKLEEKIASLKENTLLSLPSFVGVYETLKKEYDPKNKSVQNQGYMELLDEVYGMYILNDVLENKINPFRGNREIIRITPSGYPLYKNKTKQFFIDILDAYFFNIKSEKALDNVLETLKPREKIAVRGRYGLDDKNPKTYSQIGDLLSVTLERARQITLIGLRKLRHPLRYKLFKEKYSQPEDIKVEKEELPKTEKPFLSQKITDMAELSVRAYCCLRVAGIKTLGELAQKTEEDMLRYRNFGRKSLNELKEVLAQHCLHFGMKLEDIKYERK